MNILFLLWNTAPYVIHFRNHYHFLFRNHKAGTEHVLLSFTKINFILVFLYKHKDSQFQTKSQHISFYDTYQHITTQQHGIVSFIIMSIIIVSVHSWYRYCPTWFTYGKTHFYIIETYKCTNVVFACIVRNRETYCKMTYTQLPSWLHHQTQCH